MSTDTMSMSATRIGAVIRKELAEFRRNRFILVTASILPLIFLISPTAQILAIKASAVSTVLQRRVETGLFLPLLIPVFVPSILSAYAVVGEREQGTLEPVLGTPIRTGEFMLGKALAVFVPAASWSYLIFGVIDGLVWLIKPAAVSTVALRPSILLAQLIFTPLLVCMAVWGSMTISARARDVRVAQQLAVLVNLPVVAVLILMGVHVIQFTAPVAVALGAALAVLDVAGWPLASKTFNRERLVLGTR